MPLEVVASMPSVTAQDLGFETLVFKSIDSVCAMAQPYLFQKCDVNSMTPESSFEHGKTVGVNQPYYFPYAGFFGLIENCQVFVVYDDAKYTKRGWINRNRIMAHGSVQTISLPLKRSSDFATISEKVIAESYDPDHHFRILRGAYSHCAHWPTLKEALPDWLDTSTDNLFEYLLATLRKVSDLLEINTDFVRSSAIDPAKSASGVSRLRNILRATSATNYLNLPGGRALYSSENFADIGVRLGFVDTADEPYEQSAAGKPSTRAGFEPRLSILDLLANLGPEGTKQYLRNNTKLWWAS